MLETADTKSRLVADLSRASRTLADEQNVNDLSPDQEWEDIQCDYIDQVVECLMQFLDEPDICLTKAELIAIKADLKSAFMQIPLHLSALGSIAVEFDGWIYVFARTPFGWRWATHTWSDFTRAMKLKLNNFNKFKWEAPKMNNHWSHVKTRYAILSRL